MLNLSFVLSANHGTLNQKEALTGVEAEDRFFRILVQSNTYTSSPLTLILVKIPLVFGCCLSLAAYTMA